MLPVMSIPFSLKTVGNFCFVLFFVRISFIVFQVFLISFLKCTDRLNELVNSNDNHVHTILVAFWEPLGLS